MLQWKDRQLFCIQKAIGPEKRSNYTIYDPHAWVGDAEYCLTSIDTMQSYMTHGEKGGWVHITTVGCEEIVLRMKYGEV